MGGLQNTVVCSAAMRLLPIGFPKIICSTIASGYRYFDTVVGDKDIMVVPSIVDFAGMNPVNEAVLGNTVSALIGMVTYGGKRIDTHGEKYIATTLMGITNDTVMRASDELTALIAAFEAGQFAHRVPLGVEVPFLMRRGPHVLRGRIDAVYRWEEGSYRFLVVDWKTTDGAANPLQLAVYRQAWAEAQGIDPALVAAAFYHVASDALRFVAAPASLIDRAIAGREQA